MSKFLLSWGMVLGYILLNAFGALIIKHKINEAGPFNYEGAAAAFRYFGKLFVSPQILFGFCAIFGSAVAWMIALSRLDLSIAYPVATGLNFLIVVSFSIAFYSEAMTVNKAIGIALVMSSIYFLSKSG